MKNLTATFNALSDRNRLRMAAALMQYDELCACQLVELIQVKGATASKHMGVLINSGLVTRRKQGKWVYYSLNRQEGPMGAFLTWLETELRNDVEFAADAKQLAAITLYEPEELCRKQRGTQCCPVQEATHG